MDKKKVIGAAAGAAAAVTAVGIAAATKLARKRAAIYHVRPVEEGWVVEKEGAKKAASHHDTKRDAVAEGRSVAGGSPPSRLVIHRTDGSVQREHTYE